MFGTDIVRPSGAQISHPGGNRRSAGASATVLSPWYDGAAWVTAPEKRGRHHVILRRDGAR